MAKGLFIGLNQDELLAIRAKAVAAITQGLNVVSYSDSGSSVTKSWALKPEVMLEEVGHALYILDPLEYAAYRRTSVVAVRWDSRSF
jgi:hypothetical protein